VFRIKEGIELTPFDRKQFHNKGEEDRYITYKNSKEFDAVKLVEEVDSGDATRLYIYFSILHLLVDIENRVR